MRFEHDSVSLWYGTADAPAPGETVLAGSEVAITVGVSPTNASNWVGVSYRLNQAPEQMAKIRLVASASQGTAQYFETRLGPFEAGDTVEYRVSCTCAGRVFPPAADIRRLSSSFR